MVGEAKLLKSVEFPIARGEGIGQKAPELRTEKLTTRRVQLIDSLPYRYESFDVATMLAVLEHLSYARTVGAEI